MRIPTLFLLCGLPGSGKTTLAKQLETQRPALRLTPDEWMAKIVGDGFDQAKRAAIEAVQWEIATQALRLGIDVVLDWGFWSRSERDEFRSRAKDLGAHLEIRYLDVPPDELVRRLVNRNKELPPDTFPVTPNQLEIWSRRFEAPTPDEL